RARAATTRRRPQCRTARAAPSAPRTPRRSPRHRSRTTAERPPSPRRRAASARLPRGPRRRRSRRRSRRGRLQGRGSRSRLGRRTPARRRGLSLALPPYRGSRRERTAGAAAAGGGSRDRARRPGETVGGHALGPPRARLRCADRAAAGVDRRAARLSIRAEGGERFDVDVMVEIDLADDLAVVLERIAPGGDDLPPYPRSLLGAEVVHHRADRPAREVVP